MLSEAVAPNDAREIVEGRLKRGETIPGFDHPLYPNGDPRAIALLDRLEASYPESQELAVVRVLVNTMDELNGLRPNMYLALASLCSILGLPVGSPLAIFAISRTVGWIAQALEQYALNTLIRPRAIPESCRASPQFNVYGALAISHFDGDITPIDEENEPIASHGDIRYLVRAH